MNINNIIMIGTPLAQLPRGHRIMVISRRCRCYMQRELNGKKVGILQRWDTTVLALECNYNNCCIIFRKKGATQLCLFS